MFNIKDLKALGIGITLAVAAMLARNLSAVVTKRFNDYDRKLVKSIFARGLAAAAIAQVVVQNNIEGAAMIAGITYAFITFTILLSSIRIFLLKRNLPVLQEAAK